jgi:hypothetical protein
MITKKIFAFDQNFDATLISPFIGPDPTLSSDDRIGQIIIETEISAADLSKKFAFNINNGAVTPISPSATKSPKVGANAFLLKFSFNHSDFTTGSNILKLYASDTDTFLIDDPTATLKIDANEISNLGNIELQRAGIEPTLDIALWDEIDKHYLRFKEYEEFIDFILCRPDTIRDKKNLPFDRGAAKNRSPFIKSDEYNLIKFATDFFMLARFGLDTSLLSSYLVKGKLPYYDIIVDRIKDDKTIAGILSNPEQIEDDCDERAFDRLFNPIMIELIWSYWMEQGMLVQTMNVINLRFQNIKGDKYIDRLMRFDTDPLRPLSHILWGYIQDEQHRLSLPRRLNEYDHEYGLTLTGRAVPRITPVDSRVKFLEAFHSLLTLCTIYFHESDDTTVIADAFPILHSLKEVHMLLAEGNHNAYGNLTWTARQEMMMQQYILSRSEMREFLGGRTMVPYPETWMDRVETMRNIQGWGSTSIVYFYELAVHGELILLSIRYGNWSDVTLDRNNAANWAQKFRNSIQRYIHAYRVVTGVDLSVEQIIQLPRNYADQPAYLIQQRLLSEPNAAAYLQQQQSLLLGRGRNRRAS